MIQYILFGAGEAGIHGLDTFGKENVAFFCDNYMTGMIVGNKEVISFHKLKEIYSKYRVVITPRTNKIVAEIVSQLNREGIPFVLLEDELNLFRICQALKCYAKKFREIDKNEYEIIKRELLLRYQFVEFDYIDISRIGEMMALVVESSEGTYDDAKIKNVFIPKFQDDLFADEKNANAFLYNKISEKLEVITECNVGFWSHFIDEQMNYCRFNARYSHQQMMKYQQLDILHGRDFRKNFLSWTKQELVKGKAKLGEMGLQKPYVCFFARSQKYLDTIYKKNTLHPNDLIRNQPIENYKIMTERLGRRGIPSVRMGYLVDSKVDWDNVVDYANNFRSEFMDFYTIANSEMFVSSPSGIQHIALMYNIPNVVVDLTVFTAVNDISLWLDKDRDLMIFQKIIDPDGKYLTMQEIFSIEEEIPNHYERMGFFLKEGFKFEKNTPMEIWNVVEEMLERKDGIGGYSSLDVKLQNRYWELVEKFLSRRESRLTWYAQARVGRDFLRANQWILE